MYRQLVLICALALLGSACDDDGSTPDGGDVDAGVPGVPAAVFDLDADLDARSTFFDLPWPSDLRLDADGSPVMTGYPTGGVSLVRNLIPVAERRPGYSTVPIAYFRFGAAVAERSVTEVIEPATAGPVLLVDVDPDSPDRGRLFPTVATSFASDLYTGEHLVGAAAMPGIVLSPDRTYAFVILRSYGDADGAPLEANQAFAQLAAGETPAGARGADAAALYAPMFETLDTLGVAAADVAVGTVFTTGDVVEELYALTEGVRASRSVSFDGLTLDTVDGDDHERYCELVAQVDMPQYQVGTPPFDTDGLFEIGPDGLPIEQRVETARVVLTIPKTEMPASGYPLMIYFHGSGGIAAQVVDRGPRGPGQPPATGRGPAHMIAQHGIASVGAALPLSPDRLPGASSIEYLNFANLSAFPDTFRQGVVESRLMIDALAELRVDPAALGACMGPTLPAGETEFFFDVSNFLGLGQSMGGMYTNLVGAVEPRLSALVPTGAGGFWPFFILETTLIASDMSQLLSGLLRVSADDLTHLHPSLGLLTTAWETAEPMVFMPRLSRRPLPELSPRPIYQPVGQGDSFFPTTVFDAMALAYAHPQAGDTVWPTMQDSLSYAELDGIVDYPVQDNLTSDAGGSYTGVVVQDPGDGFSDPHTIYVQVPEIRYQWGCFLATAVAGQAVVPAPAAEGSACPGL